MLRANTGRLSSLQSRTGFPSQGEKTQGLLSDVVSNRNESNTVLFFIFQVGKFCPPHPWRSLGHFAFPSRLFPVQ